MQYRGGEVVKTYGNLEPRFSAKVDLGPNSSIKLSYNRLAQYIHLISNTTASTPLDIWTPSTNNIRPQIGDQIAGGYFRNFGQTARGSQFEASVEVYYKWLQNQIDYIDGANLILNKFLEGDLLNGRGRTYGAEFYLKKNSGTVNGWISYTLARTERLVEGINNNAWFPTRFDKPHTLTSVLLIDPPWWVRSLVLATTTAFRRTTGSTWRLRCREVDAQTNGRKTTGYFRSTTCTPVRTRSRCISGRIRITHA